jgi:hypothetical protein
LSLSAHFSDTEKLLEKELSLEAYFTFSHKAIALDKDISGSKRRKGTQGHHN